MVVWGVREGCGVLSWPLRAGEREGGEEPGGRLVSLLVWFVWCVGESRE